MSDCHRSDGSSGDNFSQNKLLFLTALQHYFNQGYTYIEIGDGDELWENNNLSQIIRNYIDIFKVLANFYKGNRFYMLLGNHDIVKRNKRLREKILKEFFDENNKINIPLFPNIAIKEGLTLRYSKTNNKILLAHGHQGDFLNDTAWRFARLLVKYVWRPLELIGIQNITSAAENDNMKSNIEKELIEWTIINKQMLIAGHTHRQVFPKVGEHLYFNDGCCTHPHHITGIEITDGSISLVKWEIKARKDRTLFIDREVLSGPVKLTKYFDSLKNKQKIKK